MYFIYQINVREEASSPAIMAFILTTISLSTRAANDTEMSILNQPVLTPWPNYIIIIIGLRCGF